MNQNDFRALLSAKTSGNGGRGKSSSSGDSSGRGGGGGFGGKRNMTESDLEEIRRLSKKPKKKGGKKSGKGKDKAGDDDDADGTTSSKGKGAASTYRDRAAERRQGVNSDMIDAEEFSHFDAEQTKFLGGDMEHTHLVKGLDFALLSQLKREKEKLQQAMSAQRQQNKSQHGPGRRVDEADTRASSSAFSEKLAFKSRVGRLVYFHAVQSSAVSSTLVSSRVSEHFLPGRMYYTFSLNANEIESVPVIVQRSKDDCPEPDDVVSGMVSELVISKVGDALRNMSKRHGGGAGVKKLRKKKKHSAVAGDGEDEDDEDMQAAPKSGEALDDKATAEAQVDSDEEDIFPEVGEYVPIHARAEEEEEGKESSQSHSESKLSGYFSNLSASISAAEQAEKKREEEAEHAWKQTIRKVVATQSQAEREKKERERLAREAQGGAQVDEYSECYPEYQAAAALDSEDEEEKPRKGVDKDDDVSAEDAATEKTRRRKQKQGNKLQNDLEKINKILETKK
ncbi:Transmembrane protein [Globisporangium polare]